MSQLSFPTLEALQSVVGAHAFTSDWVLVDQKRIDQFAVATSDPQWIHIDYERAARESPFGSTIAHGFLTLSLLGKFYDEKLSLPFCQMGINYGLNKVRFISPVKVNSRVRGQFHLSALELIEGGLQMIFTVTIEVENQEKPACVAESIVRQYFSSKV